MKNFLRKTVKKGELRNLEVELISLLFDDVKPVNGKGAVVKGTAGISYNFVANATKFKSDDQGRLYVTVMEPETVDSQGDKITKPEIVKAMDHFVLTKGLIGRNDVNHNMQPVKDVNIVENYILKSKDADFFPDTKLGAWVQVLKCEMNSDTWTKVKGNKFNGVSIYGRADDIQIVHADNSKVLDELKEIRKSIEATGNVEALKVVDDKIKDLEKADDSTDMKELLKSLNELIVVQNRAINKSIEKEPGGGNMDEDKEITIAGGKVIVKAYHRDIVEKSFSQEGDPEMMNILTETNSTQFIDEVLETVEDETLKEITVTNMNKDNKVDVGVLADMILVNESDGEPVAQTIVTGELEIAPSVLKGEYKIERKTVEFYKQKLGEAAYLAFILKKLSNKAMKALKILLFKGDRASGTATLAALDGVIKLATTAVDVTEINSTTYTTWATKLKYALQQFGDDYLEHMDQFVIYVSLPDLINIRTEAQNKINNLVSRLIIDPATAKVTFDGIPIKGRRMTSNYIVMGLPLFIIIGVRTDAEVAKRFIPWYWHWYIRLRAGITYVTGFVKIFSIVEGS